MTTATNAGHTRNTPARRTNLAGGQARAGWLAAIVGLSCAVAGCTAITPEAVKARESSGATRRYDRPATDVYSASVAAIDGVRAESNYWNQLKIVERDPAKGTVIAEQNLDSAVVPGLGTRDAIGIFVKDVPPDSSDVTVVVMGSDQLPGSAATSASSWPTASSLVFPAIDQALESIPETPRTAAVAAPVAARPSSAAPAPRVAAPPVSGSSAGTAASPPPVVHATTGATSATVLDRVYDTLRASGSWRPLVRETRVDGSEEIRVGSWAALSEASDGRVRLAVRESSAHAADAARLALELSQAGFAVVVESENEKHHSR